jgi:hypothetical protein
MTAFRLIPISTHAALEMVAGAVTMAAPFVLGFHAAGAIVAVIAGALYIGLAAATAPSERPGADRGTVGLGAHYALDRLFGFGLVIAAIAIAIAGDRPAALFFGGLAIAQAALASVTRYSPVTT